MEDTAELVAAIRDAVGDADGLRLLVLHGSRARGQGRADSDIDVAFLGAVDLLMVTGRLVARLGTDAVDLVDLSRASGLLRLRVAQEGVPILERPAGAFTAFQIEASRFWCDVETVVREAHEQVLASLPE